MEGLGSHIIAELFDCNESCISNCNEVESVILTAAELAKTTVIKHFFHEFSPYGISGVVIIAESHFTIHTWPEYGYAAVDIFSCGDIEFKTAIDYIQKEFEAKKCSTFRFNRGILPDIDMQNVDIKKEMFERWRKAESAKRDEK